MKRRRASRKDGSGSHGSSRHWSTSCTCELAVFDVHELSCGEGVDREVSSNEYMKSDIDSLIEPFHSVPGDIRHETKIFKLTRHKSERSKSQRYE